MLAITFVIPEKERLVPADRPSQSRPELVALEIRDCSPIKKVSRVERAVPQKFECRPMNLVCAGLRDNNHLRSGALAVLGAVSVCQDVELADGINSQKLPTRPTRLEIDFRHTRIFDPV